jgi:uncharacterized membrane protein YhaH (DUF805 family)
MNWMFLPLKRYADFSGRSRRKEYWMFALLQVIVVVLYFILAGAFGATARPDSVGGAASFGIVSIVLLLYCLAIIIPSIAVQVRRFHDQDKSGWMVLLGLIPGIGGIIVLVFMCLEGTRGPNRFGPDPKTSDADLGEVFS